MADFHLFKELKRRNVLRAAALYAGAVWALSQGISQLGPSVGAPDWVTRWFLIASAIGFPFWLAFAWLYEFTPSGLQRESEIDPADASAHHTGRKLNYWIFGVMALAIVLLATNQFVLHRGVNEIAAAAALVAPPNSIAVLPFTNESSDKQQDYFAVGISEDLLNLLTEVQPLRVAARASSFSFRGKHLGIPAIATRLHVANVLEGSVFKEGDEVRISAELVRASDGYQIWSHIYDRKLTDIFAIQDGIARDVVKHLKVKLLGALPTARQTNPRAYVLYLQARAIGNQFTADAFKSSNALLRQALAIDPRYAPAWGELARNFANEALIGALPADQGFRQARDAALNALAIDPDYAPAQAQLGGIAMNQNDLPAAARHFKRALALDPTDPSVLGNSADLLLSLGRLQPAIVINEYVVARDPVDPTSLYDLASNYLFAGRYDEAIATYRKTLSLSPGYSDAHFQLAQALLLKGDASAALATAQQMEDPGSHLWGVALASYALGQTANADAALHTLIARYARDDPYNIAQVHAYRGEADPAFAWLDEAVQASDSNLALVQLDPLFDKLHVDPRWLPFLRKIGHAPEQLAKIEFTVTLPGAASAAGAHGSATSAAVETSTDTVVKTQAGAASTGRP